MIPALFDDPYLLLVIFGALLTAGSWFARYIVWPGLIERLKRELRGELAKDAGTIADFNRRLTNSDERNDDRLADHDRRLGRLEERQS